MGFGNISSVREGSIIGFEVLEKRENMEKNRAFFEKKTTKSSKKRGKKGEKKKN